jgi:hypothetical protein
MHYSVILRLITDSIILNIKEMYGRGNWRLNARATNLQSPISNPSSPSYGGAPHDS